MTAEDITSDFVILLARQRSGTNPLRSVLGSHPEIDCTEEVFNNQPPPNHALARDTNFFRFLDRGLDQGMLEAMRRHDADELFLSFLRHVREFYPGRTVVMDIKYNSTHHLNGPWHVISEEPKLFGAIKRHQVRVLNLTRRNFLRYYLSELKAQQTGAWDVFDESVVGDKPWYIERYGGAGRPGQSYRDPRVTVPVRDMVERLELCRRENEAVRQAFDGYAHQLTLDYVDIFRKHNSPPAHAALEAISKWLGINPEFAQTRPQYKKQSALPLRDSIANYGEVADALTSSGFEYCLQDEPIYTAEESSSSS